MAKNFDVSRFADQKMEEYNWFHEAHGYQDEYSLREEELLDEFTKITEAEERALGKYPQELYSEIKPKENVVVYEKITKREEVTERKYVAEAENKKASKTKLRENQEQQAKQEKEEGWLYSRKPKTVTKVVKKNKGMER